MMLGKNMVDVIKLGLGMPVCLENILRDFESSGKRQARRETAS